MNGIGLLSIHAALKTWMELEDAGFGGDTAEARGSASPEQEESNVIDVETGRNMYGCTPCPSCGGEYRWPTQERHPQWPSVIRCEDCGLMEPYVQSEDGYSFDARGSAQLARGGNDE